MKKIILLAIASTVIYTSHAQTFAWAKSLGSGSNEEGHGIAVDANGNVYTTGSLTGIGDFDPGPGTFTLTSGGSTDAYVSKLDAAGNFVWAIRMGGTGPQSASAITVDNTGNIYITGNFNNTIDMDPGPGVVNITSLGSQDAFVAKYDPSGNHVWSKRFGGTSQEIINSIAIDGSGNVITCGSFSGTTDFDPGASTLNLTASTTSDAFVSKLDASGNYVWVKQVGLNGSNTTGSLVCDAAGYVYLTGMYEGTADFDPGAGTYSITSAGLQDIFVLKLDNNGSFSWAGSIGGTALDAGHSVAIDATGNVVVTGEFQGTADLDPTVGVFNMSSVSGVKDIFISKFNPATAAFIWAVSIGDANNDVGNSIKTDIDNNIYVTGTFIGTVDFDPGAGNVSISSNGSQRDCFILKLDASGNYLWAGAFGSNALGDDVFGIFIDAFTNIYTTGYYQGTVDFDPGAGTSNITSGGQLDAFIQKIQQCTPPAAPVNTTAAPAMTICGSGSTTLTATGSGTLGWYDAASGGNYLGGGSSYTSPALNATTVYYVQDSTCSEGPRTAITVAFSSAMNSSVSSQTNITCNGDNNGSAGVSISGGTPGYTYLWSPSGGNTPAAFNLSATTYTCTITDANGCSINQIVTITEPAAIDTAIIVTSNMITAQQSGATYQWIDCNNSNLPIAGETNQTYSPAVNGNYAVIITIGSCSDTSNCSSFTTGINANELPSFSVYPNPTSGSITIQTETVDTNETILVFNSIGQLVMNVKPTVTKTEIQLPETSGIYLIRLNSEQNTNGIRVIKK